MSRPKLYKIEIDDKYDSGIIILSNTLASNGYIEGILVSTPEMDYYKKYYKIGHHDRTWGFGKELESGESITLVSKEYDGGIFQFGNSIIITNNSYRYSTLITKDCVMKIKNPHLSFHQTYNPKNFTGEIHYVEYKGDCYKRINKLTLVNK